MTPSHKIVLCFVLLGLISDGLCQLRAGQRDRSRGTFLGYFETLEHDVSGAVWALDDEWLHVEGFTYDGRGPDAFFWVGTEGDQASPQGHIVPFPSGASGEREMVLPAFSGENVLFRLPDGVKVSQLRWISVWCRRFTVNFGSLKVPPNVVLPKKRKLAELSRLAHAVRSGNVTLLDSKTIYIPNLHYDGQGPDAYFWVGKGVPDRSGRKIPNEKKSLSPLESYEGVDIELVLPDNLTVYDIDYLSLWCVKFTENFGDVKIPLASELFLPPALGQTQVKSETGLQPLQPSANDQYHTKDEVHTTAQMPTSSEPAVVELSSITIDGLILLNETSTQLPNLTAYTDSDKFSSNETHTIEGVIVELLADGLSTTETMTQTTTILKLETENPLLDKNETAEHATNSEHSVSSTSEMFRERSTSEVQDFNSTENKYQKMNVPSDDSKIGMNNIGGAEKVMSSDFYLATPDKEKKNTFRYGLAKDLNNMMAFDTNKTKAISTANASGVVLGDFGGMPNDSLSENEYTFKYDADPERKPVSRNESEITEILVHEGEGRYQYSVGNDHAIQHVIDDVNFQPHGLVQIDSQKHSGAYFYGLPPHTDHESESLPEQRSQEEDSGQKESVKHHPKDVYSVPVRINLTESKSGAGTENPSGVMEGTTEKKKSAESPTESPTESSEKVKEHSEKNEGALNKESTKHSTESNKEGTESSKESSKSNKEGTKSNKEGTEGNKEGPESQEQATTESVKDDTGSNKGDEDKKEESETEEKESESSGAAPQEKDRVSESKKAESAALPNCIPGLVLLLVGVNLAVWHRV